MTRKRLLEARRRSARASSRGSAGGSRGGSGGSGGGAAREPFDPLESIREQIEARERLAAQIGMTESEALAYRAAQEAISRAQQEGIPITDTLRASIAAQSQELERVAQAASSAERMQRGLGDATTQLADALADAVVEGGNLSETLGDVLRQAAKMLISQGISQLIGAAFGGGSFANGAAFSGGRVTPFARGGVVNGPTMFPMAKGAGLMGEAGPEAIMPLSRGPDGKLGVTAAAGGDVNIEVVNATGVPAEVNTSRDASGAIRVELTRAMRDAVEGGQLDAPLRRRFGVRKQARGG